MSLFSRFTFPEGVFEHAGQWTLGTGSWQMMIIVGPFNLSRYGERLVMTHTHTRHMYSFIVCKEKPSK